LLTLTDFPAFCDAGPVEAETIVQPLGNVSVKFKPAVPVVPAVNVIGKLTVLPALPVDVPTDKVGKLVGGGGRRWCGGGGGGGGGWGCGRYDRDIKCLRRNLAIGVSHLECECAASDAARRSSEDAVESAAASSGKSGCCRKPTQAVAIQL